MKKLLFILFVTVSLNAIDFLALPSLMDCKMDSWYKTPSSSAPKIHKAKQVFKNQAFTLLVFLRDYQADKNDTVDITYDFEVFDPNGKATEDNGKNVLAYKGKNPKVLILPRTIIKLIFTDEYKFGVYKIKITAYDNISKKSTTKEIQIKLVDYKSIKPKPFTQKDAYDWFMQYYKNFETLKAIESIKFIVKTDKKWIKKNHHILHFFKTIFLKNQFLFKIVEERFSSFNKEDQKKFLLIYALCDKTAISVLSKQTRDFYNNIAKNIKLPSLDDKITSPDQLDMLWAEFFATGTYDPIKKLVNSLKTNCDVKDKKSQVTCRAAMWSLNSNANQHELILKYLAFMQMYESFDDKTKSVLNFIIKDTIKELKAKKESKNDKDI